MKSSSQIDGGGGGGGGVGVGGGGGGRCVICIANASELKIHAMIVVYWAHAL